MAQILSAQAIAPGAQFTTKEVQTGIHRLQLTATGSAATGWQPNDITVTVTLKNRSGGSVTLCSDLDLYTLSRLRDNDDGGYSVFNLGGSATANILMLVTLGYMGANIYLDQTLYVEIVIRNNSATVTYTVTLDGIEAPITRAAYMRYDRINFAATTNSSDQSQFIGDSDRIWVPQTATPWTQLRMSSPTRNTLSLQGIGALRGFKLLDDSLVSTDSAGATPLYSASLPAALDGAVIDVRGFSDLTLVYTAVQTVTKRIPRLDLLTSKGSEVFDPVLAQKLGLQLAS
jgi:hypothetical protein